MNRNFVHYLWQIQSFLDKAIKKMSPMNFRWHWWIKEIVSGEHTAEFTRGVAGSCLPWWYERNERDDARKRHESWEIDGARDTWIPGEDVDRFGCQRSRLLLYRTALASPIAEDTSNAERIGWSRSCRRCRRLRRWRRWQTRAVSTSRC